MRGTRGANSAYLTWKPAQIGPLAWGRGVPIHIAHPAAGDPLPFSWSPPKADPDPWGGNPMHSQPKGLLTPCRGRCTRPPRAGEEDQETADLIHFILISVSLLTQKYLSSTRTGLGTQMFGLRPSLALPRTTWVGHFPAQGLIVLTCTMGVIRLPSAGW